jgi:hypothetical protein
MFHMTHQFICSLMLLCGQEATSSLRLETTPAGRHVVARLPADLAGTLPLGVLTQEQGEAVLTLSLLDDAKKPGPNMLGKYVRAGNELTFAPRFPLLPGSAYRARLTFGATATTQDFALPALAAKTPPRVLKILPSADVLPANLLRLYIYFDRPMRGGKELFKHLVLLDDKGKEIDEPWLVDEIWDEANNCLILFIHPGRIKWGVELREAFGPVLHEKRNYSLVVRGSWTDLDGNKLGADFVKKFRTTPEDRSRIELSAWKVLAPKANTKDALTLTLPTSVDYRSLQSGLIVTNGKGEPIAGAITIGADEKLWQFTPAQPWQAGPHHIDVSSDLEDVAGNTPERPFDMDLQTPRREPQKLKLDFAPRP